MLNYSTKPIYNNTLSEEFKQRIQQNRLDSIKQLFTAEEMGQIPSLVIKVKCERAVIEKALIFKEFIDNMIEKDYKHYVLDFSDTLFLDSTFLGSVILFLKKVKLKGSSLSLVVNKEKLTILSLFENFNQLMSIHNSVDEALDTLAIE
jgi:anti-sigma B factor antagonist